MFIYSISRRMKYLIKSRILENIIKSYCLCDKIAIIYHLPRLTIYFVDICYKRILKISIYHIINYSNLTIYSINIR